MGHWDLTRCATPTRPTAQTGFNGRSHLPNGRNSHPLVAPFGDGVTPDTPHKLGGVSNTCDSLPACCAESSRERGT